MPYRIGIDVDKKMLAASNRADHALDRRILHGLAGADTTSAIRRPFARRVDRRVHWRRSSERWSKPLSLGTGPL
jgi:hypothetical protein